MTKQKRATKTMKNIIYKKIFPIILLLVMIAPFFALAAATPPQPYTLMSGPIPGLSDTGIIADTSNPAIFIVSLYWYIFGLGVALAVLMIVWGGIGYTLKWTEFMATDSKNRITNAVIGLVILFTSWLILYTINTNLVGFNVDLSKEGCNSPLAGNAGGAASGNSTGTNTGSIAIPQGTGNQTVFNAAQTAVDTKFCTTSGLSHACANTLSSIMENAHIPFKKTNSTIEMNNYLKSSTDWKLIPIVEAGPGDIIMSPTGGSAIGHVGVLGKNGNIMTSSHGGPFEYNYTIHSWSNVFVKKGLPTYAYRYNK